MVRRLRTPEGTTKSGAALAEFASAVAAFDPDTASRAQIVTLESELTRLGQRLAAAEVDLRREHREITALHHRYLEYLQAAQLLEAKLHGSGAGERQSRMEASLVKMIGRLQTLKSEIERREREDKEAQYWLRELRGVFDELVGKLRRARDQLDSACRQKDTARSRKAKVGLPGRWVRETPDIVNAVSAMSAALDATNRLRVQLHAEAGILRVGSAKAQAETLENDPEIAAVLGAPRGTPAVDQRPPSDRRPALRKRAAAPRLFATGQSRLAGNCG